MTEVEGEKALCLPNVGKPMLSNCINYTCKIPLGNIVVINSYRRNSPRTSNTTTRQAAEIKLAANLKKEQRGTELILLETETLQNLISYKPSNNKIGERPHTIKLITRDHDY